MRKAVIGLVVLIAVAAIPWLGCPIARAGDKSAALGRVGVGKHEATVELHEASTSMFSSVPSVIAGTPRARRQRTAVLALTPNQ